MKAEWKARTMRGGKLVIFSLSRVGIEVRNFPEDESWFVYTPGIIARFQEENTGKALARSLVVARQHLRAKSALLGRLMRQQKEPPR